MVEMAPPAIVLEVEEALGVLEAMVRNRLERGVMVVLALQIVSVALQ
jgi:hypothetical protein